MNSKRRRNRLNTLKKNRKGMINHTKIMSRRTKIKIFLILIFIITIISLINIGYYKNYSLCNSNFIIMRIKKNSNIIDYLWNGQLTISVLAITVFSLILSSIDTKIAGLSVKDIMCSDNILLINYVETLILFCPLSILSFLAYIFCNYIAVIVLFTITLISVFWMLYVTYLYIVEKEPIYYKLKKIYIKDSLKPNSEFIIINEVMDGLIHEYKMIDIKNPYIVHDISIMLHMLYFSAQPNIMRKINYSENELKNIILFIVKQYNEIWNKNEFYTKDLINEICKQEFFDFYENKSDNILVIEYISSCFPDNI